MRVVFVYKTTPNWIRFFHYAVRQDPLVASVPPVHKQMGVFLPKNAKVRLV